MTSPHPWDVPLRNILTWLSSNEKEPRSRFRLGSPCRWSRTVDMTVHVILPWLLAKRYPKVAEALRRTSPRWGWRPVYATVN